MKYHDRNEYRNEDKNEYKTEYKTGLMNIKWDLNKIFLVPVFVLLNLLIKSLITDSTVIPIWFDDFFPLLGACISGPLYGALIAFLYRLCITLLSPGTSLAGFVFAALMAWVAIIFGTLVRLGFLSRPPFIAFSITLVALVESILITPITFAFFGNLYSNNFLRVLTTNWLQDIGVGFGPSTFLSFFVLSLLDKTIVILLVLLLVRLSPEKVTTRFGFMSHVPFLEIVDDMDTEYEKKHEKAEK